MNIFEKIFGKKIDLGEKINFHLDNKRPAINSFYKVNLYSGTFKVTYTSILEKETSFVEMVREDIPKDYQGNISKITITKKYI